ncbi:MAG TPA: flagellar filament outer layer protein FlaA [Spirochaetota bacterium]|nr:flagellar filament outer layer protein FlaA [Spirochaetota bacterium]
MFKKFIMVIMALALIVPLYAQEKKEKAKEDMAKEEKAAEAKKPAADKKVTVWQEIVLEDFETTPYSNKNITYNVTSDQDAKLTVRDQLPATANSKKYLGLKFKTKGGDIFVIKPAKELIIDKYCKSVSFWVYGRKNFGQLTFMLQDTKKDTHVIMLVQTINFSGWKQITVPLRNNIAQDDDFLNQKKTMKIVNIQYKSATSGRKPSQWEYLYLDDITATVRERYDDKQSDEW